MVRPRGPSLFHVLTPHIQLALPQAIYRIWLLLTIPPPCHTVVQAPCLSPRLLQYISIWSSTLAHIQSLLNPADWWIRSCYSFVQTLHWIPISKALQVKIFKIDVKILWNPVPTLNPITSSPTLPPVHCTPATLSSLLFLGLFKHVVCVKSFFLTIPFTEAFTHPHTPTPATMSP